MSTRAKSLSITGLIIATIIATFVVVSCTTRESGPAKNTQGVQGTPIATDTPNAPTAAVGYKGDTRGILGGKSPYTVMFGKSTREGDTIYMAVTINGPAKEILVTHRQPNGKEISDIVSKVQLLSNNGHLTFPVSVANLEKGGTFVLTIKDVETGKIVWQETTVLPPQKDTRVAWVK